MEIEEDNQSYYDDAGGDEKGAKDNNLDNIDKENNNEDNEKGEKIKLPKRKYAIIHGYLGHNYCGNQKNPGVASVEEEIENALFKNKLISPCNYGTLQKIGWSRASRTDKKVSSAMNLISCKLHYDKDKSMDDIINDVNKSLPEDIKIIKIIEVSGPFNAKDCSNNREYHFILPSFCLMPKSLSKDYLKPTDFKIKPEYQEKVQSLCTLFRGTKRYHNYTKKIDFKDPQSQRIIFEVTCHEIFEIEGTEYIKFKLVGQSFLYNQIRKMIGMIIKCCRDSLTSEDLLKSFENNKTDTPLAPAEGLYLYKIDYSKYNTKKKDKKNNIDLNEEDIVNIDNFTKMLRQKVHESERDLNIFSKWIELYDKNDKSVYIV